MPTLVSVTKCLLALLCQSAHLLIQSMVVLVEVQKPYHFENDFFVLVVEWMNDLVAVLFVHTLFSEIMKSTIFLVGMIRISAYSFHIVAEKFDMVKL